MLRGLIVESLCPSFAPLRLCGFAQERKPNLPLLFVHPHTDASTLDALEPDLSLPS
jgi:hypothetical protein